ncbi:MAG: HEAT repeat domain-containing protein [Candidatus Saganbacteria bacterium]|nr:HEAT repeat domain-containing protein [Candidatus Saganbacteria bacterium]
MGLWCNGVDDSAKKLQIDFFSTRQKIFKHLGFKDRNNNGVIEAKKKTPLNKLIRAEEGYGAYDRQKNIYHQADLNKDGKIDEKESWYHLYLKAKLSVSQSFIENEIMDKELNVVKKDFKAVKKNLDRLAGYLRKNKTLLAELLANALQIGINKKNKKLVEYVINYLHGCQKNHKGIHPVALAVGKQVKGINQIYEILHKIFWEWQKKTFKDKVKYKPNKEKIESGIAFVKAFGGMLGDDFVTYIKIRGTDDPFIQEAVVLTKLLTKPYTGKRQKRAWLKKLTMNSMSWLPEKYYPLKQAQVDDQQLFLSRLVKELGKKECSGFLWDIVKNDKYEPNKAMAASGLLSFQSIRSGPKAKELQVLVAFYKNGFDQLVKLGDISLERIKKGIIKDGRKRIPCTKLVETLKEIGTAKAKALLKELIKDNHYNTRLKGEIAQALLRLKAHEGIFEERTLMAYVLVNNGLFKKAAARYGKAAVPALSTAFSDHSKTEEISGLLIKINSKEAHLFLWKELFRLDNQNILSVIVKNYKKKKRSNIIFKKLTIVLLKDPKKENRRRATDLLRYLGEKKALPYLYQALKDQSQTVANDALYTIRKLKGVRK